MSKSDTTTTCAKHPRVTTSLRCASCGTPICPRCLVQTPVGAKCKSCATGRSGTLFSPSPLQATLAAVAGAAAGAVAGLAVEFSLGFFTLFLAFGYGAFAGEMILRASGRRRGLKMEIITGVTMAAGAIAGRMLMAAMVLPSMGNARPPHGVLDLLVDLALPSPIPLIALVIAIGAAVSRIRYI